ncbi:MAG: aldo/keto reductase [Candidatus Eisenbacteria bacterium]|uniref:Aldo/keto reductase n=1 Tax=Eiseniibacteriota bacterium TaxID=2212470 RepID=A0A956RRN8_UNCEI|nr:aldo/keto reductase [Candidatus Eisenbacteria bacterium]
MHARRLGNTDLYLSVLGLGTWAIGGAGWKMGWGAQDDAESIATIQRALDLGINWIDTAPAYGQGHSEEVVGRAIRGRRDEVIVATKCGLVWEPGQYDVTERLTADSVRREIDDSLRRLQVEVIDLYQIHWPDPDPQIEEAWTVIAEAIRAGKIRYGGVSNFDVAQMLRAQAIHPIASLQPNFSMIAQKPITDGLLEFCARERIGVVAYSPLAGGLLTEKMSREWAESLPEDDWRSRNRRFREDLSANLKLVDGLRALAHAAGRTVPQLAIAWVLHHPETTSAIVGARRPAQIEELVAGADFELSADMLGEIDALLAERSRALAG